MGIKKLSKNEVLTKVIEFAELYQSDLLDKNMIIICYNSKDNNYSHMESAFLGKHFVHLTGIKIRPHKGADTYNPAIKSEDNFYQNCLTHRVKLSDFELPNDGTVELKMQVLSRVLSFTRSNNMMGSFSGKQNQLYTEKLVGNIHGCMGFVEDPLISYHVPNTVLKKDIRDITIKSNSIVCIFERNIGDTEYNILRYIKSKKTKKKRDKKTDKKIVIPPIDHFSRIKTLDIVTKKVSSTLIENIVND